MRPLETVLWRSMAKTWEVSQCPQFFTMRSYTYIFTLLQKIETETEYVDAGFTKTQLRQLEETESVTTVQNTFIIVIIMSTPRRLIANITYELFAGREAAGCGNCPHS